MSIDEVTQQFDCQHCQNHFPSQLVLKLHSRSHYQVMPVFLCGICNKKFITAAMCKLHQSFHRAPCVDCENSDDNRSHSEHDGGSGVLESAVNTGPGGMMENALGNGTVGAVIGSVTADTGDSNPSGTTDRAQGDVTDTTPDTPTDGTGGTPADRVPSHSPDETPGNVADTSPSSLHDTPSGDATDTAQTCGSNSCKVETHTGDIGGDKMNSESFTCTNCHIVYQNFALYMMHIACHSDLGAFICSACGHDFQSSIEFNLHIMNQDHFRTL